MADTKVDEIHLETVDYNDSQRRNNVGEDADHLQGYWKSPRLIGSVLADVLLANSLYIGYAMPVNILSVINADIGPSPNIYLVTMFYTLLAGVLLLVVARLSDIFGRRYFLIGGQLLGVIGSPIFARANNINTVIGGSVLTGMAGAGAQLYPLLIHELLPNKHRGLGQGAITLTVLPTLGFAPAIARALVAHTGLGWRWCYWLNVIVSGLSILLFFTCYFPPSFHMINSELTKWQEVKQLDYGGLVLYFGGLVLVILGFTWAEGIYAWKSAHVIASLVVGVLSLIAFALYEAYMPLKQPLLPVKLFRIRNFTACVFIGSAAQMVYLALNVLWPTQISSLFTTDNLTIGLLSSTTGGALVMGELIFSPLFRAVGYLKWQLVTATVITAVFAALMAAVTYETEGMAIAFTILAGMAVGWIEMVTLVIVGLVAPPNDIGVAQGFFGSTRLVFGTIAISIYLCIFANRVATFLPQEIVTAVQGAGLPANSLPALFAAIRNGTAAALETVPGVNDKILGAFVLATKHAYADALKIVYLTTLAFTGVGAIAAFFITDVNEHLTNYVNKTIHKPNRRQKTKVEA